MEENKKIDHPWETASVVTKDSTFVIESHLYRNSEDDKPLQVFTKYSNHKFIIIRDGKAIVANIHTDELTNIWRKTKFIAAKDMDIRCIPVTDTRHNASSAYTVRIGGGKVKGKTPVEVLREDFVNGKAALNEQYLWIKSNIEKYEKESMKNSLRAQMDAIKEAAQLSIEEITGIESQMPVIPEIELADILRPNPYKKNQKGMVFAYECKIVYDCTRRYPVIVRVSNYYAPIKTDKGLLNVMVSQKDKTSLIASEKSISIDDWYAAVFNTYCYQEDIKHQWLHAARQRAEKADYQNRRQREEYDNVDA